MSTSSIFSWALNTELEEFLRSPGYEYFFRYVICGYCLWLLRGKVMNLTQI